LKSTETYVFDGWGVVRVSISAISAR